MAADRKVPAPSNTPGGGISGTTFMEDVLTEVQALYRYVQIPLSTVVGANTITAVCDVALDVRAKGNKFTFTSVAYNTGAATLEINDKGPLPLRDRNGAVLAANRLMAGRSEVVEDFGTEYRLLLDSPAVAGSILRSVFVFQMNSGTHGGASATGWNKIPLNTIIQNDIGLTFNAGANQITLPAGIYRRVLASAFNYTSGASSLHLWNVSDNQAVAGFARVSSKDYGQPSLTGEFTLASSKVMELRLYTSTGQATYGLGYQVGVPLIPEQYACIEFEILP